MIDTDASSSKQMPFVWRIILLFYSLLPLFSRFPSPSPCIFSCKHSCPLAWNAAASARKESRALRYQAELIGNADHALLGIIETVLVCLFSGMTATWCGTSLGCADTGEDRYQIMGEEFDFYRESRVAVTTTNESSCWHCHPIRIESHWTAVSSSQPNLWVDYWKASLLIRGTSVHRKQIWLSWAGEWEQ